jgi:hypothetical protein
LISKGAASLPHAIILLELSYPSYQNDPTRLIGGMVTNKGNTFNITSEFTQVVNYPECEADYSFHPVLRLRMFRTLLPHRGSEVQEYF